MPTEADELIAATITPEQIQELNSHLRTIERYVQLADDMRYYQKMYDEYRTLEYLRSMKLAVKRFDDLHRAVFPLLKD